MNMETAGLVLVVDDDPFVLDSAGILLRKNGYEVVTCGSAAEALEKFHGDRFDAVLTDIRMPGLSGLTLLELIHGETPEIPVILMTAYADLDTAIDAIKKGAFDFIIKPYKPEQLLHSTDKAIRYYQLTRMEEDYRNILEEFNEELETLIAERTMSLMALTVADRVRNPAAVIKWTCRKILDKGEIGTAGEDVKKIMNETERLDSIVEDFQVLLRNRKSMFRYEDINAIVRNAVSVLRNEAVHRGIDLTLSLSEQPLRINMQRNLLRVAVFNLIRNSIESTPSEGKIEVKTYPEAGNVVLSITDTGHGIKQESLDRIFEPFFSTKEHRFGMGLPLVRQIVTEHFGTIKVSSEPAAATTFTLTFPSRWLEKSTAASEGPPGRST